VDRTEILQCIEAEIQSATGKSLTEAEKVVLQGTWEGQTYEEMAEGSSYAINSLKNDAGPNLWKLLSQEVFGRKIGKANFRAIAERHRFKVMGNPLPVSVARAASATPVLLDWGEAPTLPIVYGRTDELQTLKQWILEENSQLIELTGLHGMGKTTTTIKLIEEIKDHFEVVIWRSLAHPTPPSLLQLLNDILAIFPAQSPLHSAPSIEAPISVLLDHFRHHRCLLILDNAESLMQLHELAGHYDSGYEDYRLFFSRIGTERHQSCLLFTSQVKLSEILALEAQQYPVRSLSLAGLPENDARQILASKGLTDETHWGTLIEIFQGNPLALQLISAQIRQSFGGRVGAFLKEQTITLRHIEDLLHEQFQTLSALEEGILRWLARTQPLSFSELKESLESELAGVKVSGTELLDAVESLLRRSLIHGEAQFRVEPIVQQYIISKWKPEQTPSSNPEASQSVRQLLEKCFDTI
jgi:hypothetical protein